MATIAAAAMVLASASAAAGPQAGHPATNPVRAAGFALVKQVGPRNYAGPNCPGAGWNCTKSGRVLQIATAGGQNVAVCSDAACTIDQNDASNQAACIQRTSITPALQTCVITQAGARNTAIVSQTIDQKDDSDQMASQSAQVTQGAGSGTTAINTSNVSQFVRQHAGPIDDNADPQSAPAAEQLQDAFQSVEVNQSAVDEGKNTSQISQSQGQKARNAVIQSQNTRFGSIGSCASGPPFSPNACADVSQELGAGKNANRLSQTINEDALSHVLATQTQGRSGSTGGLLGKVHQLVDTSGGSTNNVNQSKEHRLKGADGSTQIQHDPVRCCGTFSQTGGTNNHEDIDQSANVRADGDTFPVQTASLIGDSRSDGRCTIQQHASINGDSTSNSGEADPCPILIVATSCTSSFVTEGPPQGGQCTAFDSCDATDEFCSICNFTQCGDRIAGPPSLRAPGLGFLSVRPRVNR